VSCTEKSIVRLLKWIPHADSTPAPMHSALLQPSSSFTGLYEKYFIPWHMLNGYLGIYCSFTKHCTTVEMPKACYTGLVYLFLVIKSGVNLHVRSCSQLESYWHW